MKELLLTIVAVLSLSSCDSSSSSPKPQEETYETGKPSQASNGRCLDETDDNDSINKDLKNLKDRVHEYKHVRRALRPEECLAAAAYAKTYDYFGETCVDKNARMLESWISNCYTDDWREGAVGLLDCSLPGHKQDIFLYAPSKLRALLTGHLDECEWSQEEREGILNPEIIRRAVRLIRLTYPGEL